MFMGTPEICLICVLHNGNRYLEYLNGLAIILCPLKYGFFPISYHFIQVASHFKFVSLLKFWVETLIQLVLNLKNGLVPHFIQFASPQNLIIHLGFGLLNLMVWTSIGYWNSGLVVKTSVNIWNINSWEETWDYLIIKN